MQSCGDPEPYLSLRKRKGALGDREFWGIGGSGGGGEGRIDGAPKQLIFVGFHKFPKTSDKNPIPRPPPPNPSQIDRAARSMVGTLGRHGWAERLAGTGTRPFCSPKPQGWLVWGGLGGGGVGPRGSGGGREGRVDGVHKQMFFSDFQFFPKNWKAAPLGQFLNGNDGAADGCVQMHNQGKIIRPLFQVCSCRKIPGSLADLFGPV